MTTPPREIATSDLENLLATSANQESAFQTFFERRSFALPTPFLLGQHIQFQTAITKLPIDTSLICDFCYITRSSARTQIVLIEIEAPGKRIFTKDNKYLKEHSNLTHAQAQIGAWRDYIRCNRDSVLNRLSPLLKPKWTLDGPIDFKYVLIYGRRTEFEHDPRRLERYRSFTRDDTFFLTYDRVITALKESRRPMPLNIMRLEGQRYTFKYMHDLPQGLFSHVGSGEFFLSPKHRKILIKYKYEIDKWEAGEALSCEGMYSDLVTRLDGSPGYFETADRYLNDVNFQSEKTFER